MNARQIEVFRTIMRLGTLTGAAQALNVSQPALSQLLDVREANGDGVGEAFVSVIAQAAAEEWDKHRGDVLWNPKEAKRQAKEADERRNKAELSAKFSK